MNANSKRTAQEAVHPAALALLEFWLAQEAFWFSTRACFDRECKWRFAPYLEQHTGWGETPQGALAEVLLLDQMPRNIFRGQAQAFAFDEEALAKAQTALAAGFLEALPEKQKRWLLMPFMHTENLDAQREGVAHFTTLGNEEGLRYMREHCDLIERFGRFPHRNKSLGRTSTQEEKTWLAENASIYGSSALAEKNLSLPNGISLTYEREAPAEIKGLPVLLMRGLGTQLIEWPFALIAGLLASGREVILYDHRDAGASTKCTKSYTLVDMGEDAAGLLRGLDIKRAHVFGISMGGMIAPLLAAAAPERIASLILVMTGTGFSAASKPATPEIRDLVFNAPEAEDEASILAHELKMARALASSAASYDWEKETRLKRAVLARAGAKRAAGIARHTEAIRTTGDISSVLAKIEAPVLVLHGDSDLLVPIENGRKVAEKIEGAVFASIAGMGHDVPETLVPVLLDSVLPFLAQNEPRD